MMESRKKGEIVSLRRSASFGACVFTGFLLACGIAGATTTYPDRVGDVVGGSGPDIVSLTVWNTKTTITFQVRFATSPPLRVSTREQWVDMLLIGIDVPPLGAKPKRPGGEWPGANFALGTHGPSKTGLVVRTGVGPAASPRVATFKILTRGTTVAFTIPCRVLGNPAWFTFSAAAARESEETTGGGVDLMPSRGTYRYTLT